MDHYEDAGRVVTKLLAQRDERIKRLEDLKSDGETAMTVYNILNYRDKFVGPIRYIVTCRLMRGYYTEELKS